MNDDLTTPTTIATGHQPLTTDHDWGPSIMIIYSMYVWETTSHATRTTCITHRPTPLRTHPQAPYHACEDLIALQYTHTLYLIHPSTDPHTPFAKLIPHRTILPTTPIHTMMLGDGG